MIPLTPHAARVCWPIMPLATTGAAAADPAGERRVDDKPVPTVVAGEGDLHTETRTENP